MREHSKRAKNFSPLRPTMNHNRHSIRLQGYDYSLAGAYFLTLCTQGHSCLFGKIVAGQMILNDIGMAVADCWSQIPAHFPDAELDAWVVMPNHVHGIVVITSAAAPQIAPSTRPAGTSKTIGSVVRGVKIGVTKWCRQRSITATVWQRNYWEHIVRSEAELERIRRYVVDNPSRWGCDSLRSQATAVREELLDYGQEDWMV